MTGVLIVDDQMLIRGGLAALLHAAPGFEVLGEAGSGDEAVSSAARCRPDVILMDVRMPGCSGIAATERILAAAGQHPPKVLILTTFDLDEYVYAALRVGASGFMLKDTAPQRLLSAISTVAGGDMLFAPTVTRRLIDAFASRYSTSPEPPPTLAVLTNRELEVLRLVGGGLSNADIARYLVLSEATVKTHINRLMAKSGLSSRAQAVVLAYETGLVTPRASVPAA